MKLNDPDFFVKKEKQYIQLENDQKAIFSEIQFLIDKINISNSSNLKKQNHKELIELANFLFYYNQEIKIDDVLTESPDFIVTHHEKKIGIELKDLIVSTKEKEKEGIKKSMFRKIEEELSSGTTNNNGLYKIKFENDNQSLKKKEREGVKNEIIGLITGQDVKPKYVSYISKDFANQVHLCEDVNMIGSYITAELIKDRISSKEKKIKNYLENKIDELWLLLVISGAQKSSYYADFEETVTNDYFESTFDKIFIYDTFSRRILKLNNARV